MKKDKTCEEVSKEIKEKIDSIESVLREYGISEKTASGKLDNVLVYCGDEELIKRRKVNIPIVTVLIRNPLEYKKLAEELSIEPKDKTYGVGIGALSETSFEYEGVKYVTLALQGG